MIAVLKLNEKHAIYPVHHKVRGQQSKDAIEIELEEETQTGKKRTFGAIRFKIISLVDGGETVRKLEAQRPATKK